MVHIARSISAILNHRHDALGLPGPALEPGDYRQIVRTAFDRHGLSPFEPPEDLLAAEGFTILHMPTPRGCGICSPSGMIAIPHVMNVETYGLVLHHERAHAWLHRLGYREATEADAWFLTAELVGVANDHVPAWFSELQKVA